MPDAEPEPLQRWYSRNAIALGAVSFLTDIHSETILALLPQFMADVPGVRNMMVFFPRPRSKSGPPVALCLVETTLPTRLRGRW